MHSTDKAGEVEVKDEDFDEEANRHEGSVRVWVTYVNTTETKDFRMPRTATLNAVFEKGYDVLGESKRPTDEYFCEGGLNLAKYLTLTLEELHKRKVCRKRRYEISGPTGGA